MLTIGVCLSWLGAESVRVFPFHVEPFDAVVTARVALAILGLALVVTIRPVLSVSRLDPARVLRQH